MICILVYSFIVMYLFNFSVFIKYNRHICARIIEFLVLDRFDNTTGDEIDIAYAYYIVKAINLEAGEEWRQFL